MLSSLVNRRLSASVYRVIEASADALTSLRSSYRFLTSGNRKLYDTLRVVLSDSGQSPRILHIRSKSKIEIHNQIGYPSIPDERYHLLFADIIIIVVYYNTKAARIKYAHTK